MVYTRPAPLHWDFNSPSTPERREALRAFLAQSGNVTVGYRANRAVVRDLRFPLEQLHEWRSSEDSRARTTSHGSRSIN